MVNKVKKLFDRRQSRVRYNIKKNNKRGIHRVSVFRSAKHFYAQIIDDSQGITLVSASTISKDLKGNFKNTSNVDAAYQVGKFLGEIALKKGINEVIFDRGGYLYHGRVKHFATALRESGMKF